MSDHDTETAPPVPLGFRHVLSGERLSAELYEPATHASPGPAARHMRRKRGLMATSHVPIGIVGDAVATPRSAEVPAVRKRRKAAVRVKNPASMSLRHDPAYLRKRRIALALTVAASLAGPALVLLLIFGH